MSRWTLRPLLRYSRPATLAALCALGVCAATAAPTSGVVARDSTLRERPYPLARAVAPANAETAVEILGRQGYWLEVRVASEGASGWLRLIDVRYPSAGDGGRAPARGTGSGSRDSGFFSSLSRGATGLLGGGSAQPRETTTIGIRGLDAQDLATAGPDHGALKKLDAISANPSEAKRYAHAAQLHAREIPE